MSLPGYSINRYGHKVDDPWSRINKEIDRNYPECYGKTRGHDTDGNIIVYMLTTSEHISQPVYLIDKETKLKIKEGWV
jgi:hypothetical protein